MTNTRSIENLSSDPVSFADWKRPAAVGYLIITLTFVVIGGWSALARLDSAVVAPGVVMAETNRKTVQHLEGGIIRELPVREGQRVDQGQILIRLDPTAPRANLDLQQNQLDSALAQEARLVSERDRKGEIDYPEEIVSRANEPIAARAMEDQRKQFEERRTSLIGQVSLLETKIEQFKLEISGLLLEREATTRQLQFILEELADMRYLLEKNLVQKTRVNALEREKSRLEGVIGRSTADQSKAENGISEAQLQIRQLRQKFLEDVSGQILEVRQKISDAREKVRVSKDILWRLDIVAPVSGTIQNVKVFTSGGVVRPGEPLMEIVPETDSLIIQAHVQPYDIESLAVGMRAEIKFSAFRTNSVPIMLGRVESVSRDRLVDEQSRQPYFLAQIVADDIPHYVRERLTAGMQAEVILPTGERTVLDYIVRPLHDRMYGALRER